MGPLGLFFGPLGLFFGVEVRFKNNSMTLLVIISKGQKKTQRAREGPKIRRNQKQKDRAVLPKPKLIVYIDRSQKLFLNLIPIPKLALKDPKSVKKAQNLTKLTLF